MEALNSLQSLSSVAIWPVLMMNWRSIVAYFPAVERFIDGLNVDVLVQLVLGTRLGLSGLGLLFALALAHLAYSAYRALRDLAMLSCYTKCSISEHSTMHDHIVSWITRNPQFRSITTGEVVMRYDAEIEVPDDEENIDVTRMMNEIEPEFKPEINKIRFWSRGAYFWMVDRKDKKLGFHGKEAPDNYVDIYCFNWRRSTGPLKGLLMDILKEQSALDCDKTIIYTPEAPHSGYNDKACWYRSKTRRRRPLSTVILDQQQKDIITDDVRNFLTKSGVAWYHEKGLPLRLGYLFHGPPGTGKSSLAFALASHFGMPVYMMNLSAPNLSDSDVESLFSNLPHHCIVLLEDVDATQPLSRDLGEKGKAEDGDAEEPLTPDSTVSGDEDETKIHRGRRGRKPGGPKRGNTVTLSGLLNAIDGVAASEGRILIQTTNHIENLDEALIRTGRADRIITFTHATKQQAEDMFANAYTGTRWVGSRRHRHPHQAETKKAEEEEEEEEDWDDADIADLARAFAAGIRGGEFSPALLQQYFKDFRAEPRRAVRELAAWMRDPRGYRKPSLDYDVDGSLGLAARGKANGEEEEEEK